jgi:amidase
MKLAEYAGYDALGLRGLSSRASRCRPRAGRDRGGAIAAINPAINAVVETYPDRIEALDERSLGRGPFRAVPFLMRTCSVTRRGARSNSAAGAAA